MKPKQSVVYSDTSVPKQSRSDTRLNKSYLCQNRGWHFPTTISMEPARSVGNHHERALQRCVQALVHKNVNLWVGRRLHSKPSWAHGTTTCVLVFKSTPVLVLSNSGDYLQCFRYLCDSQVKSLLSLPKALTQTFLLQVENCFKTKLPFEKETYSFSQRHQCEFFGKEKVKRRNCVNFVLTRLLWSLQFPVLFHSALRFWSHRRVRSRDSPPGNPLLNGNINPDLSILTRPGPERPSIEGRIATLISISSSSRFSSCISYAPCKRYVWEGNLEQSRVSCLTKFVLWIVSSPSTI